LTHQVLTRWRSASVSNPSACWLWRPESDLCSEAGLAADRGSRWLFLWGAALREPRWLTPWKPSQDKMADDIERIKEELEEARNDLHRTVAEVNRQVETVNANLHPAHLLRGHLLLSGVIAGALGFAYGRRRETSPISFLLVAGLVGAIAGEMLKDDGS
jgi:hypothetical protein